MNLVRYHGLELPVFAEEPVAWSQTDIEVAAANSDQFVRRISVYDRRSKPLKQLLALTDALIEEVCELTDATPVPYAWGLHPLDPGAVAPPCRATENCYHEGDIPTGYHLVAEVESVKPIEPEDLGLAQNDLLNACYQYQSQPLASGTPYIYDVGPHQFMAGQTHSTGPALHYVDFEPRLTYFGSYF